MSYHIGQINVQRRAVLNGFLQRFVGILGQTLLHHLVVEHHAAENFCYIAHA